MGNRPEDGYGDFDHGALDAPAQVEPASQSDATSNSEKLSRWALRAVEAYPRPSAPTHELWEVSIAGLARRSHVPRIAAKPLGLLDRLGAVHVGPENVGFDGTEVSWDRVTEIRTQPAWTRLTASMLKAEFEKYASAIPPLPGRAWAVRTCSSLLVSLYLAVIPPDEDGAVRLPGEAVDSEMVNRPVVTEISYRRRGFGSAGQIEACTAATVLQLLIPEATAAIVSTAHARQVSVRDAGFGTGEPQTEAHRGAQWRKAALSLQTQVVARNKNEDDVPPQAQSGRKTITH